MPQANTVLQQNGFPEAVSLTDVTTRDGFQNIKPWIPTEAKLAVLDLLVEAGVKKLEATAFVSPKAVPQMADAAEIVTHIRTRHPHVELVALTPNLRGVENAIASGVKEVSYIISASEQHNLANINRTHAASLDDLANIHKAFPNLPINLSISMVFGCPFTGAISSESVVWLIEESLQRGIGSITLCDTIGVANPLQVEILLKKIRGHFPQLPVAGHFHDTHGMGLANTVAALRAGVTTFETAAGGLGGCPFAPGAAGNTSTEDMLNMLLRMGIATGVDLEKYLTAVAFIKTNIPATISGRLSGARTYSEYNFSCCTP